MTGATDRASAIDELLDRSVAALNRGDVTTAHDLAERVLAADTSNRDAAALLEVGGPSGGELRRLSLLFCDLVGSTELSARHEPETYRTLVRRYKAVCRDVVEQRYGGHISHFAGDGMLAVFGLPTAHENDAERAARAGLDIVRELQRLSAQVEAAVGERLEARAAVHRGLVYLDVEEDDVYGLAANVVARLQSLAAPGTVVMSDDVREIVGALFETVAVPAQRAKGIDEPLQPHRIVAERPEEPTRGRRWEAALVNRNDELALMRAAWLGVRGGGGDRPATLHLLGEAGIGKSRLAAVLAEEARAGGGSCLQLLASPFHAQASFHAIRSLIEVRAEVGGDLAPEERLARLEREVAAVGLAADETLPLMAPVVGVPPDAGYRTAALEGRRLHDAIVAAAADYVVACLGSSPALLIVEDLHWCDESTLDVLSRVLHADRGDLLVVTTSRDPAPSSLGRIPVIDLSPLDDEAAAELVRSLDPALDDITCRDLVDRGDGMPLYLEELARGAASSTTQRIVATRVTKAGSPSPAAAAPDPGPVGALPTVPEALYEPLVARLHATGQGLRVASAAAAIGRDVEHGVLAQVVDVPDPDLEAALEALLGGLILERVLGDDQRYRFRHELLRVVAYELQPPSRRRELHGRVAAALAREVEAAGAVDWRLVASHHDAAGQVTEAVTAYQQAADGARRLGALGEARALLSRAIELVPGLSDAAERSSQEVGLRLRRGFLVASAEGTSSPEAVQDYERCLELTLGDSTSDEMFSTLIPLWGYYMLRGDLDRAQQVAEMLRTGVAGGRDHYRPDNEAAFGAIRWFAGDFGAARDQLEAAVEGVATRRISPDYGATYFMPFDGPASANANLALARFMRGDVRGADEQFAAGQQRCDAIEFPRGPFTAAEVESYAAWTLIERGDLGRAAIAAAAVTDIAEGHGFDFWLLVAATEQATIAGLRALDAEPRDAAALAAHAQALEGLCGMWRMLDVALFLPAFMATVGRLRAAAGDIEGAVASYAETLEFARSTGIRFYEAEVLRLRAQLLPRDDVSAALRAALDVARSQGAAPFELRIARDLLANGDADGLALVAEAVTRFAPDARYPELDDARSTVAAAG
jgi:class 3 adenylate cyclase/tetratricopeptide (TPR) repeat protein